MFNPYALAFYKVLVFMFLVNNNFSPTPRSVMMKAWREILKTKQPRHEIWASE